MKKLNLTNEGNDEQLVTDYINGDNNAMGILYSRYYEKVYYRCLGFYTDPDTAGDMAQDILLKVIEKIRSFKHQSSFSTWLYSIATNHCLENLRKNKKVSFGKLNEIKEIADNNNYFEMEIENDTKFKFVERSLDGISKADKELLEMKYRENISIKEIQEKLNIGASAIKMRLQRARRKIMELYHQESMISGIPS